MIAVGELAVQRHDWVKEDAERQLDLIKKAGLPTHWPNFNIEEVIRTLQGDKKVKDGLIRFIIPKNIGKVEIRNDITLKEISNCLSRLS